MTAGHKHRFIQTTSTSWLFRVLVNTIVWRSRDLAKVEASRFVYKPAKRGDHWVMSLLGFLHPLTGLTLELPDPEEPE